MNHPDMHWQRLVVIARSADERAPIAAPAGFSARVAARAFALQDAEPWSTFERYAFRGLCAAVAVVLVTVTVSYATTGSEVTTENDPADLISEILAGS
jgi:hypothetical protein